MTEISTRAEAVAWVENLPFTPEYQAGYIAGLEAGWRDAAEYHLAHADWKAKFYAICCDGIDRNERRRRESTSAPRDH